MTQRKEINKLTMTPDLAREIYQSYVGRIHDFRREQHMIIIILVGLFTLAIKALLDLAQDSNLRDIAGPLYGIVTVASIMLTILFMNHAYIVLLFSGLLKRLEKQMAIPSELRFYGQFRIGRMASYLLSLFLPFALYFGVTIFFSSVSSIPRRYYWLGCVTHVFVCGFGYLFLYLIRRRAWVDPSDEVQHCGATGEQESPPITRETNGHQGNDQIPSHDRNSSN